MSDAGLFESGIYTVPEIAELVQAPQWLVRVWVEGKKNRQDPVIQNQLGRVAGKLAVSFTNLMELRFVALFHNAGVRLNEIRSIMDEVKRSLSHPHPFATKTVFRTDGKKIVAEILLKHGVQQIFDLKSKNYEMLEVMKKTLLDDVVYDPAGNAKAWYPRRALAPHVVVNPVISFGRPVLQKSQIPTNTIARAVKAEGSARIVAGLYDISEKQVREAVAFEENLRTAA